MADSPRREPGAPIPRLWKAPPPEEAPKKPPAARRKPTPKEADATPEYDTIETRRKVRIIVGGIMVAILVGIIAMLANAVGSRSHHPVEEDPAPAIAVDPNVKAAESESRLMLDQAKQLAKGTDPKATLAMLERIPASYPNTGAAGEARAALARHTKGEPFFPDPNAAAAKSTPKGKPDDMGTPNEFGNTAPPKKAEAPTPAAVASADSASAPPPAAPPAPPKIIAKPLPVGFLAAPKTELDPSGWPQEIICQRDGSHLLFIPGGSFTMGDDGTTDEAPAHRVELSAYYIDQHEVTRKQYETYAAASGGKAKLPPAPPDASGAIESHPVGMVGLRDAMAFATWAGKMLPTEAQWEFAARGPKSLYYINGEPPKWGKPRPPKQVTEVMSFPDDRSAFGVFDLSGNAWEWTRDAFDSRYYESVKSSPIRDPQGAEAPKSGARYLVKGGSDGWHLSWREPMRPERRHPYLGFRCVLNLEPPKPAAPRQGDPKGSEPTNTTPAIVPF